MRVYEFPSRLLARGKAELCARHAARFEEATLHRRLLGRICLGSLVVDRGVVTRDFPDGRGTRRNLRGAR